MAINCQPCRLVIDGSGRIEGEAQLTGTKDNDVIFSSAQVSVWSQPALSKQVGSFMVTNVSVPYLCAISTAPHGVGQGQGQY